MDSDLDDNDSPFAHVPMPGAGPGPLQDGPFTYEKLVASTGRGTLRVGPRWRTLVGVVAICFAGAALVAGLLLR